MKKFFKTLLLIIFTGVIIYACYSSIVIVPQDNIKVVYSKITGDLKVLKRTFNIVLTKVIPKNVVIKNYPVLIQDLSFIFKKKLTLLDKEINLLKYKIVIKYKLNKAQYKYLFNHYNSVSDINNFIQEKFIFLFHEKVNHAVKSGLNLNSYPDKVKGQVLKELKEKVKNSGISISSLQIINIDIIPDINYNQIKDMINQSLKYEEDFKMKLRKIELERLKLQKEAENEVEYLKIVGKYIKENPLILKYMMIKKIDKNDIIFIPSSEIGFDFYNSFQRPLRKKLKEND